MRLALLDESSSPLSALALGTSAHGFPSELLPCWETPYWSHTTSTMRTSPLCPAHDNTSCPDDVQTSIFPSLVPTAHYLRNLLNCTRPDKSPSKFLCHMSPIQFNPISNFEIHQVFSSALDIMSSPKSPTYSICTLNVATAHMSYLDFKDTHDLNLKVVQPLFLILTVSLFLLSSDPPGLVWLLSGIYGPPLGNLVSIRTFWVNDVVYMKNRGIDPIKVAKVLAEVFVEMIFVHGFVHGDPHPGNILVCPEGHNRFSLVLLDHGIYKQLDEGFRLKYCQLWKKLKSLKMEDISLFMESLPPDFLRMLHTDGLMRSTISKLGASQWVRLLAYSKFALHGLSSQSDSKSEVLVKVMFSRLKTNMSYLQLRLTLELVLSTLEQVIFCYF
ncbi:hypothetical protein UlMin_030264 [Ulmus minor]